eukprot:10812907-Prorocentrum_lima.AAC.1
MAPRTFTLTGSMDVRTPPQSLKWRAKAMVHAKLMGPFVYVLPRSPEELAAAGGAPTPGEEDTAVPPAWPLWDTTHSTLRAF